MNFFRRKDYDGEREVVDMPRLERDITGPPPAEYLPARARLDLLLEGQKIAVETIKAYHRRTTDELVSTLEHHEKVLATMRKVVAGIIADFEHRENAAIADMLSAIKKAEADLHRFSPPEEDEAFLRECEAEDEESNRVAEAIAAEAADEADQRRSA